jgi:hypothetical protein
MNRNVAKWKSVLGLVTALALAGLIGPNAALAQAGTFEEDRVITFVTPFPGVFVPCLAGNQGQYVFVRADIHILHRVTFTPDGMAHVIAQGDVVRALGIALPIGPAFTGNGSGRAEFDIPAPTEPYFFTLQAEGQLIALNGTTLAVHVTMQEILYPNGNIDGFPIAIQVDCL